LKCCEEEQRLGGVHTLEEKVPSNRKTLLNSGRINVIERIGTWRKCRQGEELDIKGNGQLEMETINNKCIDNIV
jgi:hypothetical protein